MLSYDSTTPTSSCGSSSSSVRSHRKRTLSTASTRTSSQASTSSSSLAIPELTWLEQLQLQVQLEAGPTASSSDVRYVLSVQHAASGARWRNAYTFEQYRAFQQLLLASLQHGHFCHAECPWLYSFLKSYFPKAGSLFTLSKTRQLEAKRVALEHCMQALQSFLATRSNHSCELLTSTITDHVLAFVNGSHGQQYQVELLESQRRSSVSELDKALTTRLSWGSIATTPVETMEDMHSHEICGICQHRLDGADDDSNNSELLASPTSPSSLAARCMPSSSCSSRHSLAYTMTLACGHQFHDECLVPKLNESMTCPTCGCAQV